MAKLAQTSVKYLIKAKFDTTGIVEKPDVIGALFGQTEGLLGPELDLRELQRTGRIGRIEVKSTAMRGKSSGEISIPSSLDNTETALIAASLETIDRVGPCDAKITVGSVEDLRTIKRSYIIDRAKVLLSSLLSQTPDTTVITEELMQNVRTAEIVDFKGLPSGPDVSTSDSIIVCEGRADVVNLLRHGVKNAVAIGGTSVPQAFAEIFREKEVTVFLDGDRGGDLILKELSQLGEIDFVARAPEGKEVEELTKKEVFKALRDKVPSGQATDIRPLVQNAQKNNDDSDLGVDFYETPNNGFGSAQSGSNNHARTASSAPEQSFSSDSAGKPIALSGDAPPLKDEAQKNAGSRQKEFAKAHSASSSTSPSFRRTTSISSASVSASTSVSAPAKKKAISAEEAAKLKEQLNDIIGTRAAAIFDSEMNFVGRVPLKELTSSIKQIESPYAIVLDGYVDKFLVKAAEEAGVQFVLGTSLKDKPFSNKVTILSEKEL